MRGPRDFREGKKGKSRKLPPGGGAAARARQFALERGLEQKEEKGGDRQQSPAGKKRKK
jgi:hypothetical protein